MHATDLETMYRRWLDEVWGQGRAEVAAELIAEDLIDHNPMPGLGLEPPPAIMRLAARRSARRYRREARPATAG